LSDKIYDTLQNKGFYNIKNYKTKTNIKKL